MLFKPTYALHSVLELTPERLSALDIRALILDLDNTLTTHNNPAAAKGIPQWLRQMENAGIKLLIVSNNNAPRVKPFADMLGLDFVSDGAKPLPMGYNTAVKRFSVHGIDKNSVCAVGDQIFTDILGANLAGIRSVFVYPIEPEKSLPFRIKRFAERPLLPKIYGFPKEK